MDSRKKKNEILFVVPRPGGRIIPRWHGRPPPTFQCGTVLFTPHSHRRHLHLHRCCHPGTLSPSATAPTYISRPSPLPLFLHPPPARLPPTLRAAAATSSLPLPFQVSASRDPSVYTPLMLLFLVAAEDV